MPEVLKAYRVNVKANFGLLAVSKEEAERKVLCALRDVDESPETDTCTFWTNITVEAEE